MKNLTAANRAAFRNVPKPDALRKRSLARGFGWNGFPQLFGGSRPYVIADDSHLERVDVSVFLPGMARDARNDCDRDMIVPLSGDVPKMAPEMQSVGVIDSLDKSRRLERRGVQVLHLLAG